MRADGTGYVVTVPRKGIQIHRLGPSPTPKEDYVSDWFEGTCEIDCSIEQVAEALGDPGSHFVGVTRLMPGMTSVELVEQGSGFVTIKTNEGVMKRTNISQQAEHDRVLVEFDEEYQAGSKVAVRSHFVDEFTASNGGVHLHAVVTGVQAPGPVGFMYRRFGSSRMGQAILNSYKAYFESGSYAG